MNETMRFIEITGDVNDGDYITTKHEATEDAILKAKKFAKLLGVESHNMDRLYDKCVTNGDMDDDDYGLFIEKLNLPSDDYGCAHSIKSIKILESVEIETLL